MRSNGWVLMGAIGLWGCSSSGSSNGSPDAATPKETGPGVTLDPDTKALLDAAERARKGEPTDFDGDGIPEFTSSLDAAGVLHIRVDHDADGNAEYLYEWNDKAHVGSLVLDPDSNGTPNVKAAFTSGPDKAVYEYDWTGNGAVEKRITLTYDWGAKTIHRVVEEDPEEDGTFVVTADGTSSVRKAGGDCTEGLEADFPADDGTADRKFGGGVSSTDNGTGSDGRCTSKEADMLELAFQCATSKKHRKCLADTNTTASDGLKAALTWGQLKLACGNTCFPATTDHGNNCPQWGWCGTPSHLSFNRANFGSNSDDDCVKMLHELLHWANVEDDGDTHKDGVDKVYSCARYCGGCRESASLTPPGKGITPNVDCAVCADDSERKASCGLTQKLDKDKKDFPDYNVCHDSVGCPLATCDSPIGTKTEYCDHTLAEQGPAYCCSACPTGCGKNDFPCDGKLPELVEDTCAQPAPACK